MSRSRTITRRLAAGLGAVCLTAGLAVSAAGVAQAAVPDKWGFAYVDNPSAPSTPILSHQAGTWPAALHAHSVPGPAHRVFVTFPHLASKNGVVHVTAVNPGAVWCQALGWVPSGVNERVGVRCYKPGGTAVFSPFTVMYTTSTKGPFPGKRAYGYVHFEPVGIVATFNSVGAVNTVAMTGPGIWTVRMPGLGSPVQAGGVQVTAVNAAVPAKCEIQGWVSSPALQAFQVRCFTGGSAALTTGWTLSYQRRRAITGGQPKFFAYTFNVNPFIPALYAPPAPVSFNSLAGLNTIMRAGLGQSLVRFPRVGLLQNTVLATPFHVGPGFCNLLTIWLTIPGPPGGVTVRDVDCYSALGAPTNERSLITYTAAH